MNGSKKVVVTGGGGFVLANFLRLWLERDSAAQAIVIDPAPLDADPQWHEASIM
jgi:dTDP-D-glucose 4,6-dehydratase